MNSTNIICNSLFIFLSPSKELSHPHIFLKILFIFKEMGREGERGRETSMCGCLSHWGPGPKTQACSLSGNWIGDPFICRLALNPLSYTSQGPVFYSNSVIIKFLHLTTIMSFEYIWWKILSQYLISLFLQQTPVYLNVKTPTHLKLKFRN